MYIERLTLRDIKGFGEAEFDFRRPDGSLAGWNVLAGRNGSGKSTVLKTIAMVLRGPDHAQKMEIDMGGWVQQGANLGRMEAVIYPDPAFDRFQKSTRKRKRLEVGLELEMIQALSGWNFNPSGSAAADRSSTYSVYKLRSAREDPSSTLAARGPWLGVPGSGWMLAGYGPFRRIGGESRDAHKVMNITSGIASVATLFREDASLIDAVSGFDELATLVTLLSGTSPRKGIRPSRAKTAERTLHEIVHLIEDGLLPDGVRFDGILDDRPVFLQGSFKLRLEQLSDGFRSVLALLLDLLRQLRLAYGSDHLLLDKPHPHVPHPGVVLIDEAETHLHPGWQQRLGPWLVQHFPNLQFIVTTHSPFICQSASEGGLFKLEPPGSEEPVRKLDNDEFWRVVNGSADDALLTSLFGLEQSHSQHSERLRDELARLGVKQLRTRLTKKEQARLREIERQLPTGPGPEIEKLLRVRQKED